jgi:hypothetical protein|tara:strand:+ start:132 stop:287 length:156 start_codon:yes stop_codon:yes gene_type:complete
MAELAPLHVQNRLLLLMRMFSYDLDLLFPHDIDAWMLDGEPDGAKEGHTTS